MVTIILLKPFEPSCMLSMRWFDMHKVFNVYTYAISLNV